MKQEKRREVREARALFRCSGRRPCLLTPNAEYSRHGGLPLRSESAADREVGGEERLVVDLDQDRVVAGLRERQIADFVDQVDAMQRTLGNEGALDQGLEARGVEAERDANLMLAGRTIADREEPHHERVGDGELARGNVGENTE